MCAFRYFLQFERSLKTPLIISRLNYLNESHISVEKRKIFCEERKSSGRENFIVTRRARRGRASLNATATFHSFPREKILVPRVFPRHNKYYFPKIAISPLRGYYSAPSARALVLTFANLFRSDETVRPHLETGAFPCRQRHGVYRYLYARELAFHNRFPETTPTATTTTTTTVWASLCRSISHSFIGAKPGSYVFFVRVRKLLRLFRDYYIAPFMCTNGLHSYLARLRISRFLFLSLRRYFDRMRRYCCLFIINTDINIEMIRDAIAMDDFIIAFLPQMEK